MGNVNVRPDEPDIEQQAESHLQQQHDSSYFTDDFDSLDSSFDYSQRGSKDGSLIGQISTAGSFVPVQDPQLDFRRRTRMFLSFRNPPSAKHARRNSWDFDIIHKSGSSLSLVQTNLKRITSKISVGFGIFDDEVEDKNEKCDDDEVFHPVSNLRRAKSMRYPCESNPRVRFTSDIGRAEPAFNRVRGGSFQSHQVWKQGHRRQPSISIPRGSDFGSSSESLLTKQKPLSPRVSQLKREERMERMRAESQDPPLMTEQVLRFENVQPEVTNVIMPQKPLENVQGRPTYITTDQHGRWKLRLRQDEAMDDLGCSVSIREVGSLLKSQYAYISGGRSRDHCALITFPDRSHATSNVSDEDYRKLVIYLTSVAPLQDADLGFVLIIDRRNDKWNAVKSSLIRISNFFPGLISAAYVLRPSGLLQKAISEVSNKLFREDFKFKVVVCSCLEDLYSYVDTDQLTPDFGGSLRYNHDDWIDARMSIEKFSDNVSEMSTSLKKFSRRLNESEIPNEVTAIENLLSSQSGDYLQLKEEIGKITRQGKSLQEQITDAGNELSGNVELSPSQIINLSSVQRYLKEAEELDISLDTIWKIHEGQLNQVLLLRRFELDFKELQPAFADILQHLSAMKESGDCLSDIIDLIQETELFRAKCEECLTHSDELWRKGQQLLNEYCKADSVQASVKPKTVELENMKVQCLSNFEKRLDTLQKARTLYEKIEKVNKWCASGIELLASQPLEKYGTVEHAEVGVNDIDAFLKSSGETEELEAYLQELTVPESRALVLQVLKRVEDVHVMCNRRRVSLKKIITRPPKPVQPVTPEPAVPVHLVKPREVRPRLRSASRQETSPAAETCSNPDLEALKVKRGHILTELLETEKTYVSEIGVVLRGYRDEMINVENQAKIPSSLLGKEEVLFGNLEQIHDFHSHIFLPDLEHFIQSPQMISQCFLRRKNELHELYSYYCQNIPQSEELRKAAGEQNSFLRECQLRLGHKLPLGAYLLKPVQRITKYQLLLKDLLKCEPESAPSPDLQTALDSMLAVLRTVNDSMHQVAITGYQGSLADLGRLLLQGSFNVWTEGKRDRLRDLRLKPMQRHIFLYEKAVVMCKRVGKDPDKATYQYKHSLNMSEVGLTEKIHSGRGSDGRRFELWLQGRQEVWLLQAPAVDVKETWVCEVKRVLLSQFQRLKCQTGRQPVGRYVMSTSRHSTPLMSPCAISPTANHRSVRSTASWDYYPSSSSSGVGSDRGSVNESIQSGDRTSRDTPSMHNYSNEEEDGWSTDFSLSDDEDGDHVTKPKDSICARRYLALADYAPLGPAEVRMHEGDLVELIRIGSAGWWYVRVPGPNNTTSEGWAPSAYLEVQSVTKRSPGGSTGTPSLGSQDSGMEKETKELQVFIETSRV